MCWWVSDKKEMRRFFEKKYECAFQWNDNPPLSTTFKEHDPKWAEIRCESWVFWNVIKKEMEQEETTHFTNVWLNNNSIKVYNQLNHSEKAQEILRKMSKYRESKRKNPNYIYPYFKHITR